MFRVAEHVARTDTGHQRATNEDSHLERSPVFAVADGMGGAQAGEVASQLAIERFGREFARQDGEDATERLVRAAREANAEIHELSQADARRAGMGTTLTAAYVGGDQVFVAHVGDSRAYRLRNGELVRITEDHSLVEELLRQGRLTAEEAEEHPQRSIITRALGPEPEVDVDTFAVDTQDGDVYLLCSDGLSSMLSEQAIAEILRANPELPAAADALVVAALAAGGRDNVTVVLFRVESVGDPSSRTLAEPPETAEQDAVLDAPTQPTPLADAVASVSSPSRAVMRSPRPARRLSPRMPRRGDRPRRRRRRITLAVVLVSVIAVLAVAVLLAAQSVYFVNTDANGQVTVFNGLPYSLPLGIRLYTPFFVSGVTVAELSAVERSRLFNNELRSQNSATALVTQLELGRIAGQ
jgi:protein phosphatase